MVAAWSRFPNWWSGGAASGTDGSAPLASRSCRTVSRRTSRPAYSSPYFDFCGCRTAHEGISHVDPDTLRTTAAELDAAGFQIHVHSIGDRAVSEMLDAFAAAREANGPNDLRHQMAHLQVVRASDLARFAELGVAANVQPL